MRRRIVRRGAIVLVAAFAGLMNASCATVGPTKLVSSHTAYNDAVQLAITREVIANIVRSRYSDPMQFLKVSSINAQFSVNVNASAGVGGIGQSGTAGQAGASGGYSDSPTITFIPEAESGFYKSLHSPFEIREALGFGLAYRFVHADRGWQTLSLKLSFASINNARDFSLGQRNELYEKRIDAIVRLIGRGAWLHQFPEWDFDTTAIAQDKVTAEDKVNAFKDGLYFVEEDGGENVRLARYRMVLSLELPDPDDPEVRDALAVLGLPPGKQRYAIRPPMHATPGIHDPEALWVSPRSMIDILSLAAFFVEVPEEHTSLVVPLEPLTGDDGMMASLRIRSAQEEPPFPYRVQHRGYWFYVDDSDMATRVFPESVVAAYASRVGSKQASDEGPQLILPVGG